MVFEFLCISIKANMSVLRILVKIVQVISLFIIQNTECIDSLYCLIFKLDLKSITYHFLYCISFFYRHMHFQNVKLKGKQAMLLHVKVLLLSYHQQDTCFNISKF